MPDREKVIKALEICVGENDFSACINEKCPYIGGSKDGYCITNLERDALDLLKEQEAKPVKIYDESFYFCPKCDHQFYGYYKRPNYCDRCGQAVKWE